MSTVIERIETQRKKIRISQKELCEKCRIKESTYSSWKNRNREPSIEELISLANFFNVSMEYLIMGTVPKFFRENTEKDTLIKYFDNCNEEGKNRILEHAEFISTKYPKMGELLESKII